MNKLNENLNKILDVEPIYPIEEKKDKVVVSQDIQDDAEFARENIREMIAVGSDAMTTLVAVAKDTQHPRAFEVLANMIKNMSDLNKDLMEIQKRKKDLEPKKSNETNIDKAIFVGSTTELLKLMKSNKEK